MSWKKIKKRHQEMIRRACIHEAGHALVTFKLGVPIKSVRLEIKKLGDQILYDGVTDFETGKLEEDLNNSDLSVRTKAFVSSTALYWAGAVSEMEYFNLKDFPETSLYDDLQSIKEMLEPYKEHYAGEKSGVSQDCLEMTRQIIKENRTALERLANEIFKQLLIGHGVARIDGQKVTKLLMKDAGVF